VVAPIKLRAADFERVSARVFTELEKRLLQPKFLSRASAG
jgi:hypothetical protein